MASQLDTLPALLKRAVPLVEANPATLTARFSASYRHAVACALDVANGWHPITAWGVAERVAFLAVKSRVDAEPVLFAFHSPTDDPFLVAVAEQGHFTLQGEGIIPVIIPVRRSDPTLTGYLAERGCAT